MEEQERVSQVELDQCLLYKEQPVVIEIPKGVDKKTLTVIGEKIQQLEQSLFQAERKKWQNILAFLGFQCENI